VSNLKSFFARHSKPFLSEFAMAFPVVAVAFLVFTLLAAIVVETPSGHKIKVVSRTQTREVYSLMAGDGVSLPNGQTITITEKGFEVTQ
jgi:hypothetical protein